MKMQRAKGMRDFAPEEKIVRNRIVSTLKNVFETYGYNPLETPVLERFDVLASKYAGGDEILKEMFRLKDQGSRELGLIYDFTVPMCRFMAMNPNVKMPFKRYQIGPVFRDGPIKLGRYRQFWQCDVDVVGIREMTAEAEILALTSNAFKKLNIDVIIKVNNRKLLNGVLEYSGIKEKDFETVILSVDKLEKFGNEYVKKELQEKKIKKNAVDKIMKAIQINDLAKLKKIINNNTGKQGIDELEKLFSLLKNYNVKPDFDCSLARGLSYYTGTVFEVYMKKSDVKSSIAAGGRYDKMISQFLGSKQEYPAVGISFGLDVITDAMNVKEAKRSVADVFIIPIGTERESIKLAETLRKNKIKTDLDLAGRGISKNLNYANSLGIPYVVFLGEDELKKKKVKLKDMKTGKESLLKVEEIIKKIS